MVLWHREEAPGAVDRAEVDGGGRFHRRGALGRKTERRRLFGVFGANGTGGRQNGTGVMRGGQRGSESVRSLGGSARRRVGRGAAESRRLGAGEATANAAPSARGRRGDIGFVGWGGETRRSNCAWDSEASCVRIREKDPPEIERAWEKIKRAMETGPTRQLHRAYAERHDKFHRPKFPKN